LKRDQVRLLVSHVAADTLEHARFDDLPRWLSAGDVLVVNTSGTLNAALPATGEAGESLELHLSTALPGGFWSVELRVPGPDGSRPHPNARGGAVLRLPRGATATLLAPYPLGRTIDGPSRLWLAALNMPQSVPEYLDRNGFPIRYAYVRERWPAAAYQTVFAGEAGSAEMPSAGRPFTAELVTRLVSRGIQIAPLLLHTGVSSLEEHEPPYEEYYRVSADTAARVTAARRDGRRIVAVGTTTVRALETVTDERGITSPGEGWTRLVVTREHAIRSVDGLITGFHEPRATHLTLLERVAAAAAPGACGACHLERAYAAARERQYLWHEFGDSHLIVA
jgi:S-adenosylmethionine:tRNA ribosyltransferase-isomerase